MEEITHDNIEKSESLNQMRDVPELEKLEKKASEYD
jgi:hypothetical protein